jgi:hypothetical protein
MLAVVGGCQGGGLHARQAVEQVSQSALAWPRQYGLPSQVHWTSCARVKAAAAASRLIGVRMACRWAWERVRAASFRAARRPGGYRSGPTGPTVATVVPRPLRGHGGPLTHDRGLPPYDGDQDDDGDGQGPSSSHWPTQRVVERATGSPVGDGMPRDAQDLTAPYRAEPPTAVGC